ncbi:hypothetical protein GKE82_15165 [Conexibacter sp. W3-3-2]|uniref:hypothetical protein n=1 Tax=Conexibacter sp. W3-3-2 TaxID=2675227 RepID=UPI0012B87166|nr:hypothetical protein [Conexibacter sp. W3-3-2]MTD45590.1 hypothetical protein [Conexibacter sp. W3-3-2]
MTSEHGDIALVPSPQGEVFVNRDGVRIGRFAPAWAVDAQGTPVEVRTTVQDDSIVLEVKHRDADLAYPILVDPIYEDWFNGGRRWDQGSTAGLRDGTWQYTENPAGWYPHDTRCVSGVNCGGTGDGFYIYTYANVGYNPAAGHIAEYYYTVHEWNSRTTYIPRVDYWQKNFWWGAGANFWTINGIFAPSYGNWTGYQLNGQHQDSNNSQYVAVQSGNNINTVPAAAGKQAVWGAFPNGTSHPAAAALSLGASIVYLDDPEDPTINVSHSAPAPSGWVRDYTDRISFNASDPGLGIKAFNVFYGNKVWTSNQPTTDGGACAGGKGRPCYTYRDGYFDLNAQALGSGTHAIGVCAYDALGKSGATGCKSTRTVKIDRTPPVVELSGDLYDAQDTGSMVDPFDLKVLATDAHSGVTSEEIRIGGQVQTPVFDSGCSCWSFRYKGGVGPTTVSVVVRDAVGNEWSSSWNVDVLDPKDEGEDEQQFNTDRSAPAPETPSAITESDYCQDTGGVCTEAPPALPEGRSGSGTQGFGWGMSDPSVEFMDRPEFTSLGLKKVRIIVPWDLLALAKPQDLVALGLTRPSLPSRSRSCPKINGNGATRTFNLPFYGQYDGDGEYGKPSYNHSLRGYAAWLNKARAAGYEVMVAFNRTEFRSAYCYLPTTAEYRTAVGAFVDGGCPVRRGTSRWRSGDQ